MGKQVEMNGGDLLAKIRRALPWLPFDQSDDVVSEIVILILEGRIEQGDIGEGVKKFLPGLRKKYKGAEYDISMDQPLGDEEGSGTLADVIYTPAPQLKRNCPNCRRKPKKGRTFCSRTCVNRYYGKRKRKIDPQELAELSKVRWLSRDQLAKMLGVTRHGINNIIFRYGLSRIMPDSCKVRECNEPVMRFRHCKGHMAGNMCATHRREAHKLYRRRHRERFPRPLKETHNERSAQAQQAALIRWRKNAEKP